MDSLPIKYLVCAGRSDNFDTFALRDPSYTAVEER